VTKIFGCDKNPSNVISTPQQQPLLSRNAHLKPQNQKEQHEIVGGAKIQQNLENFQQENKAKLAAPGTVKPEKMVAVVSPFVQTSRLSQSSQDKAEDTNYNEIQSNTR
uniref:Uncharacterized protein n=1 Tax=Romanomermis culicivorax TaxID=13658 RepID=A0A915IPE1_ROMCU